MSQFRTIRAISAAVLLAGAVSFSVAGPAAAADRFNCSDFATQPQAQAQLNMDRSDPNRLDANHNGIACENLPGGPKQSPSTQGTPSPQGTNGGQSATSNSGSTVNRNPDSNSGSAGSQVSTAPKGGIETGDGSTSKSSNSTPFILGGSLALIAVGGGISVAARRRSRAGV